MKLKLLCFSLLSLFLISACEPEPDSPLLQQTNPAEHNALMQTNRVFEGTGEAFYFRLSSPSGDGNIYYYGYDRSGDIDVYDVVVNGGQVPEVEVNTTGEYEVGKLSPNGDKLWGNYIDYSLRDIIGLPTATGDTANGLLTTGIDYTESTWNNVVSLYSKEGNLLNSIVSSQGINWINAIVPAKNNPNVYIGFGGGWVNDTTYPYICEISLDGENIILTKEEIIVSLNNKYLLSGQNGIAPGSFIGEAIHETTGEVSIISINQDYSIDWETAVKFNNLTSYFGLGNHLIVDNSLIYIAFYAGDESKPNSDGTIFHNSGIVQCFSLQGEMIWEQILRPSEFSDRIREFLVNNEFLYLVGEHSGFCWPEDEKCFVNGLLSKVDKYNGEVIGHYTFSGHTTEHHYSRFWSITQLGNSLHLLGTTNINEFQTPNTYDGWFVRLNLDDL